MSGVDWMCRVWTGCVGCGLDVGCVLHVSGVDCVCQVWTACVGCELQVSDVEYMCQVWTGCVHIQTRHQLFAAALVRLDR